MIEEIKDKQIRQKREERCGTKVWNTEEVTICKVMQFEL